MEKEVVILNKTGLHARPAAMFVKEASKFKSEIKVEKDGRQANAKSIISILSCGLEHGTKIKLIANGEDEAEALDALAKLIESKFGEE